MDALAAVPCLVDHDGDGDLDLLIGNIAGGVILVPNTGTPKKYAFDSSKRAAVKAGGAPIKVPVGDSGPVAADWDSDGLTDLIVGAGDGSVWWYRNEGSKTEPAYAKGVALLPKSTLGTTEHGAAPSGPGVRAKVGVADWNGDGRLDLLVGDFWQEKAAPKKLSDAESARLAELKKRFQEIQKALSGASAEERKALSKEYGEVHREMSTLEPRALTRGSVWLYLRVSKSAASR